MMLLNCWAVGIYAHVSQTGTEMGISLQYNFRLERTWSLDMVTGRSIQPISGEKAQEHRRGIVLCDHCEENGFFFLGFLFFGRAKVRSCYLLWQEAGRKTVTKPKPHTYVLNSMSVDLGVLRIPLCASDAVLNSCWMYIDLTHVHWSVMQGSFSYHLHPIFLLERTKFQISYIQYL